jgi:hypothetical protein
MIFNVETIKNLGRPKLVGYGYSGSPKKLVFINDGLLYVGKLGNAQLFKKVILAMH